MQTIHDVFVWVLGGLLAVTGFFLRGALDRLSSIEEKYNGLHEYYVKKDDFEKFEEQLWKRFDRLEIKLDRKPNE